MVTRDDIVARAHDLMPVVRGRATETEALRRIPDETIGDFRDAGFYRIFQPTRYGGLELGYGTQVDIAKALAPGCASSAWDASVTACHSWILGMFPPEAQDEVWGASPETTLSSAFLPVAPRAERVDGGLCVSGRWKLSSGVDHCGWSLLSLGLAPVAGGEPDPLLVVADLGECTIEDTWFASGLAGTGSNDIVLAEHFIPSQRMLSIMDVRGGPSPGSAANAGYLYRLPLMSAFTFNLIGVALGAARGAIEQLTGELRDRTSAGGIDLADQQSVRLRLSESRAEADAADALVSRNLDELNRVGRAGGPPTLEMRARHRTDNAFAATLCVRAIDRIQPLLGGRGLATDNPHNRAWRDVHAVSRHFGLTWDVQGQLHTAVALDRPCPDPKI